MTPQQALARLQGQCSKAEYCCGQVRRKLQRWSLGNVAAGKPPFTQEEMEDIVGSLQKDRFVDDARFANAYVRDKARFAKWGRVKIAYNLKALGVDASIINEALDGNASLFGGDMLVKLLEARYRSMDKCATVEKKREKLLRFALGRGFGYGQAKEAVDKLFLVYLRID